LREIGARGGRKKENMRNLRKRREKKKKGKGKKKRKRKRRMWGEKETAS